MKKRQKQEFIKKEMQAIYDEFNVCVSQLNMLKPFVKDLIDVADGAEPTYDLCGFLQKNKT